MLRNILLKKVKITIVNTMSYKELIINIEINTCKIKVDKLLYLQGYFLNMITILFTNLNDL